MSFRLALTGSIGMGKSTAAKMFAKEGCPVWDADAAVHRLYAKSGLAVDKIAALYPQAIEDGSVSRKALKALIAEDKSVLAALESIVHPLVEADRNAFSQNQTADILVYDIPLLFENGSEDQFDAVVVVYAPAEVQRHRVLERPNMTSDQLDFVMSRQMPSDEKLERANFGIETISMENTHKQVVEVLNQIRQTLSHA